MNNARKELSPPLFDENLIEFYGNSFESIYIILSPFIKFDKKIKVKDINFDNNNVFKNLILNYGNKVSWNEFITLANIDNISTLNKILLSNIGAIKVDEKFKSYSENIEKSSEENMNILFPFEGRFPYSLENEFIKSIKDLEYEYLFFNNEFHNEEKLYG